MGKKNPLSAQAPERVFHLLFCPLSKRGIKACPQCSRLRGRRGDLFDFLARKAESKGVEWFVT